MTDWLFPVSRAEWPVVDDDRYLRAVVAAVVGRAQAEEFRAHLHRLCLDCDLDTWEAGEFYIVSDDIWAGAGARRAFLCIACWEARLGRRLIPVDFTDSPLNLPSADDSPRLVEARKDGLELDGTAEEK